MKEVSKSLFSDTLFLRALRELAGTPGEPRGRPFLQVPGSELHSAAVIREGNSKAFPEVLSVPII